LSTVLNPAWIAAAIAQRAWSAKRAQPARIAHLAAVSLRDAPRLRATTLC
jgi:hypothetical protein